MDEAEVLLRTLRAIWTGWSDGASEFEGGESAMQRALAAGLERRLGRGWEVLRERGLRGLPRRCTAWRRYDVMVLARGRLVALLECALGDTNVAHALHNGELKLLGRCDARGVGTGKTYAEARGLTADDVRTVGKRLSSVPVRGLLFVAPPGEDPSTSQRRRSGARRKRRGSRASGVFVRRCSRRVSGVVLSGSPCVTRSRPWRRRGCGAGTTRRSAVRGWCWRQVRERTGESKT